MLTPWKESYDQPRQHIKKLRHYFANKGPSSQGYGFSSGHVWMWELDCEESWAPKNWCFWTVVLEKILESPLDCKEVQPVHPKGDQSWVLNGRTDAKAETPILWPPHAKSWLIGKEPDAGRDWGQEEKGTTRWHGWMGLPTRWTLVWVDSVSWWWTGMPGMLWFMGSQRVGHDWATELKWNDLKTTYMTQKGTTYKSKIYCKNRIHYYLQEYSKIVKVNICITMKGCVKASGPRKARLLIAYKAVLQKSQTWSWSSL